MVMHSLASVQPAGILPAHGDPVQSVAFDQLGVVVATGDTNRRLRAWHKGAAFFDRKLLASPRPRNAEVLRAIAFAPDSHTMYVACGDELRAFNLLNRSELWSFQPQRFLAFVVVSPVAITISPSGFIVASTDHGHVHAFTPEGRRVTSWWDNDAPRFLSFLEDGKTLVGAHGFTVSVWEAYSGRKLHTRMMRERTFGMALAPNANRVAVRTLHAIELLDARSLEQVDSLAAPTGMPAIAISPQADLLALAGREEVVLVDLASGSERRLPTPGARVLALAFRPGSRFLAAGCTDGVVRFWEL